MSGGATVLCVGRLYCDLIFTDLPRLPTLGTEIFAGGFGVHAGGGAFITAAHLSALGHPAALAAMLPPAPFDGIVRGDLEVAGIDLGLCQPLPAGADPQVTVALAGDGDRAFATRRSGPAFPALTAAALSRAGIGHVHVGELATLVERPEIVAIARAAGASLSLDCGWDETLQAGAIAPVLPGVDLFLPNAAEAAHLQAIGVPEPFAPLTAIKQGSDGATAVAGADRVQAPALKVDSVDTTGAGDAFNAGFIAAWLGGAELGACLQAGNAQGARAIARRGGFDAATAAGTARSEAVS